MDDKVPEMTIAEALERYWRIRYNLLSHRDKVAVDMAFDALKNNEKENN